MDPKPSGKSKMSDKMIPTISLKSYTPDQDDVDRILGTTQIHRQRDRSWLNLPGDGNAESQTG